jgi:4-hydroxybenzoate polyprenyltransferase
MVDTIRSQSLKELQIEAYYGMSDKAFPLAVDLDGTLIRTDLMVESLLTVLKQNILLLFVMPVWLLKGRAYFKRCLAERVDLDVTTLPYNDEMLARVHAARTEGRRLILSTGSDSRLAELVANHLQMFDDVQGSDGEHNLTRGVKRARLVGDFGEGGYDYIGDARADIPVWSSARKGIAVCGPAQFKRFTRRVALQERIDKPPAGIAAWVRLIRVHQWLKNLLLFVPLMLAHGYNSPQLVLATALGFVTFCLCSSAVYIINDLLDLPHDRLHPRKRFRPFASGELSVVVGVVLAPLLLGLVVYLLQWQPVMFVRVTLAYFVLTCGYSLVLKRIVIVDVVVLAALYTLRIIAGSAVAGPEVSFWLLGFSMFIFMSLALLKRFAEISEPGAVPGDGPVSGRGYSSRDANFLSTLGAVSGYSSVVVMALYINSDIVRELYTTREVLWVVCPVLLFWISHMWFAAHRGTMHDDPIVFAVKDKVSLVSAALIGLLFAMAI